MALTPIRVPTAWERFGPIPLLLAPLLAVASSAIAGSPVVLPGEGFEVERYDVELRPDILSTTVSGTETIDVRSTSDRLARLVFTPNALAISEVTADGERINVSSTVDGIIFDLPRPLNKGRTTVLRFRIRGTPARGVARISGGIHTSYFACDWMVCLQDAPGDKAHFALDLYLPRDLQSLGVGRPLPPRALANGLTVHRWRSTRPYSPYLYAFAAGRFTQTVEQTRQGQLAYLDGTGAQADLPRLFAQTRAMLAFFTDKAGIGLPDRQYAQLLVPGGEAQETVSFSLIGKVQLDREREDPSSAWVIAHELSHQWWGNLVTCETWQDFWLNEGIATFMVAAWKQHKDGTAAYRRELEVAQRRIERARELGFDKPLAWGGKYPSISVRRAIQYSKGALFLAHLRSMIGDRAFWDGLRLYTRRHAGRTVTSRHFQVAMEQASGRDLAPVFSEWVYGIDVSAVRTGS